MFFFFQFLNTNYLFMEYLKCWPLNKIAISKAVWNTVFIKILFKNMRLRTINVMELTHTWAITVVPLGRLLSQHPVQSKQTMITPMTTQMTDTAMQAMPDLYNISLTSSSSCSISASSSPEPSGLKICNY